MSVSHTTVKESHQSSRGAVLNLTAGGFLQEVYRRKLMCIVVLMIGFDHAEWKSYTILNEHRIQHKLTPSILWYKKDKKNTKMDVQFTFHLPVLNGREATTQNSPTLYNSVTTIITEILMQNHLCLTFHPESHNNHTTYLAGLLTFSPEAPSHLTIVAFSSRLIMKITATGIVPDSHRIPFSCISKYWYNHK